MSTCPDTAAIERTIGDVLKVQWNEILDRAEKDTLPVASMNVRLYDDGNFHHGSQFCGHSARETDLTARQAVATAVPGWCECGGWMGTRFGGLLNAVADQYRAIEDETSGVLHRDWNSAWNAASALGEQRSWMYRTDDLELEDLRRRTRIAALNVLESSRNVLDPEDLERRIAAQGLRIPVLPEDGAALQRWARELRVETRPHVEPRRERGACSYDHLLEEELAQARRRNEHALVVVLRTQDTGIPVDLGLPAELGLLLWHQGMPTTRTILANLLRPVAEGVKVITGAYHRVAVASSEEFDNDVLEAVRTLCEDIQRNAGGPARERIDLDDVLSTARIL